MPFLWADGLRTTCHCVFLTICTDSCYNLCRYQPHHTNPG
uniref:Uncharacterized protein n=1 Tax=Arundo donax TaxID=35708 RepID=A0A0A8XX99_ARUDO